MRAHFRGVCDRCLTRGMCEAQEKSAGWREREKGREKVKGAQRWRTERVSRPPKIIQIMGQMCFHNGPENGVK